MSPDLEWVWLYEERTFARLVSLGAYYSIVKYTQGGLDYEVLVENDDYEFWGDDDNEE